MENIIIGGDFNWDGDEYIYEQKSKGSKIDKFYVTKYELNTFHKAEIVNFKISDYKLITLDMKINLRDKWGKGEWKINDNILNDEDFNLDIKREIYKLENITG